MDKYNVLANKVMPVYRRHDAYMSRVIQVRAAAPSNPKTVFPLYWSISTADRISCA